MNAQTLTAPLDGFSKLPLPKQIGLLAGIAISIAVGIWVALWAQQPEMAPLYTRMSDRDVAEVAAQLDSMGVKYRLDPATGAVLVPKKELYRIRLKLASQGLPKSTNPGFELLEKDQGLGTSRLKELAIHQRALEGELARTISSITSSESARVHLALPRESVFVRKRSKPSASVLVNLYAGRTLTEDQLAGIVNLVASSVSGLEPEQVSVVDQRGRLLTPQRDDSQTRLGDKRLELQQRLEREYRQRILDILTPLLGKDRVRAQVVADVDYTVVEETAEIYDPQKQALRSEQVAEDERREPGVEGVPGALTNQPPAAGRALPPGQQAPQTEAEAVNQPLSRSSRATRNYEIDRTIRHVRQVPGTLRRLSVAVVVDYRQAVDEEGKPVQQPLSQEELDRINTLVREAVGFDAQRGDTVNVVNAPFQPPQEVELPPKPPIWENPLLWDIARKVLGALGILLLIFGVLRPTLRSLAAEGREALPGAEGAAGALPGAEGAAGLPGAAGEGAAGALPGAAGEAPGLEGPDEYQQHLEQARQFAKEDPKQAAQIVKTWLAADE